MFYFDIQARLDLIHLDCTSPGKDERDNIFTAYQKYVTAGNTTFLLSPSRFNVLQ